MTPVQTGRTCGCPLQVRMCSGVNAFACVRNVVPTMFFLGGGTQGLGETPNPTSSNLRPCHRVHGGLEPPSAQNHRDGRNDTAIGGGL